MSEHSQKGFLLIILIIAILLLSILAGVIIRFTYLSQKKVDLSLLSARAELAAISALEIALFDYQKAPEDCPTQIINFGQEYGALQGFQVSISCDYFSNLESNLRSDKTLIYLKAKATYHSTNLGESLVNFETGRWLTRPS